SQDTSSGSSSVVATTERSAASQDASITSTDAPPPSEVLIVKVDNSGSQNSLFWYALMGLALGCVVILAVPELREAVWSYNNPRPTAPPVGVVQPPTDTRIPELASSRQAIYNVGLAESEQAQKDLQRVIDNPEVGEEQADLARLAKAELLAMRALAFTLALSVESTAHGGLARTRAKEDADWARLLLAAINQTKAPDRVQLARVEAALDLVEGKEVPAILSGLPIQGAEVMRLVVEASPLWRDPQVSVPPGLISRLRSVSRPPTTIESVLALALVRSRDNKRALAVVEQVLARVDDQPTALTLKPWIEAKIAAEEAAGGDSGAIDDGALPSESGGNGSSETNGASETNGTKPTRRRLTGDEQRKRTEAACQEVRSGDLAKGLGQLLTIADGLKPVPFNTALCLGEGFAKQSRYAPALTWFEKAAAQQPRNVQAREGAGKAAARTNKTKAAIRHYSMLRDVNPNHPDAISYLAKHKPDTLKKKDLLPAKDEGAGEGADEGAGEGADVDTGAGN
ncbi:MAG: tetratricopeptide repeat protein, partial [Nannocystaceae bacterium]